MSDVKLRKGAAVEFDTTGRGGVTAKGQRGKFQGMNGRFAVIKRDDGTTVNVWPRNVRAI